MNAKSMGLLRICHMVTKLSQQSQPEIQNSEKQSANHCISFEVQENVEVIFMKNDFVCGICCPERCRETHSISDPLEHVLKDAHGVKLVFTSVLHMVTTAWSVRVKATGQSDTMNSVTSFVLRR